MTQEHYIHLDGSHGEGGGQILRTALALSICLQKPFRIDKIRANRRRPGLMRQHLTAVRAAAKISNAQVQGDQANSQELLFTPGEPRAGDYHFAIGTAGSATLVLQTVLLPLLFAKGASKVTIEGGTHNPLAPPYDFLQCSYLPLLAQMGAKVRATLVRPGFYPAGGGCIAVEIEPVERLHAISLLQRGAIVERKAQVVIAGLPHHIAERKLNTLQQKLTWPQDCYELSVRDSIFGPGNVVTVTVRSEHVCAVFTGFGEKGIKAERVAGAVANEARQYLASGVPVEEHLSDQLLLPMALAGKGEFITSVPSGHALTNMDVIKHFIAIDIRVRETNERQFHIQLGAVD